MGEHLVDIDETVLGADRAQMGTTTIKETVSRALCQSALGRAMPWCPGRSTRRLR